MKSLPYAWKVAIPFLILMLLSLIIINIFVSSTVFNFGVTNWEQRLLQLAHLYAEDAAPLVVKGAPYTEIQALASSQLQDSSNRVTILLPDGTVIGESGSAQTQGENFLLLPEVQAALAGRSDTEIRPSPSSNDELIYVSSPVMDANKVIAVVRLATSTTLLHQQINNINNFNLVIMLVTALIAVGLAALLNSSGINPLRKLTNQVEAISQSEELTNLPVNLQHDEIGLLTTSFNDLITRLNQQISSLKAEQATLDAVLSNMTDGAMIISREGNVELINEAAIEQFDVQQVAANHPSLIEVIRNHQIHELWKNSLANGKAEYTDLDLLVEKRHLHVIASSLGESIPGATLILVQDITRLRRLESIRRDFVSNASHELRTPLASLKALTETTQESLPDDPKNASHFLNLMNDEIDNMTQMVDEFLELAKIESGRVPFTIEPIDPLAFLTPSVERMRPQADRAGIQLSTHYQDELPLVLADGPRIQEVVVNLLHNAIKFTPPGGSIMVSAKTADRMLEVAVSDTGAGIKPADLDRIFERFYKTDKARATGGTGLGLSIARHTVEAHQGKIWVQSIESQGSTFTFSLPLAE
jgi:two-component system phosphate regulon sensor histidine kinase PhoR